MREPHRKGAARFARIYRMRWSASTRSTSARGRSAVRAYLEPDLVLVVLGGGYTAGEQTMFEAGRWYEVRAARQIWQDSMQERFVTMIEELTGRKVAAFMSANRQDPDFAVEMFVLEPQSEAGQPVD